MKEREQALASNTRTYTTGKICGRGHIGPRRTFNRRCIACENEDSALRSMQRPTLGARIASVRKSMEMEQQALAKEIGVTKSFMWRVENNTQDPSTRVIVKIANALDVSLDYLTCRTDRMVMQDD